MPKIHMKGFILQLLHNQELWDFEITNSVIEEYGLLRARDYWQGAIRVSLAELDAGGLIQQVTGQPSDSVAELNFRYRLTDFGAARMGDTGLMKASAE